jgi:hypothetical protein
MTDSSTVRSLLAAFRALAPWPSDRDLSAEEWGRYADAARLVQAADPAEVERALVRFLDEASADAGNDNESRLFLLTRFVFELPERAPSAERRVFKGWVNWPEPDGEGNVNLSWPVGWRDGRPFLLARYEGSDGPRYAAVEEYRDLLSRFPFRKDSSQ